MMRPATTSRALPDKLQLCEPPAHYMQVSRGNMDEEIRSIQETEIEADESNFTLPTGWNRPDSSNTIHKGLILTPNLSHISGNLHVKDPKRKTYINLVDWTPKVNNHRIMTNEDKLRSGLP